MTAIDDALAALVTDIKTISLSNGPGNRVWAYPDDGASITLATLPAVVVAKLHSVSGEWGAAAYGVGRHQWDAVIACYLAEGSVDFTANDRATRTLMDEANEWYKALSDVLYADLTLGGNAEHIGDQQNNKLFDYVTDNGLTFDGTAYFGHLFVLPVYQTHTQTVSA